MNNNTNSFKAKQAAQLKLSNEVNKPGIVSSMISKMQMKIDEQTGVNNNLRVYIMIVIPINCRAWS